MDGFKKLQRNVSRLEKEQSVPFDILFNESFMLNYTKSKSIDDFFKQSPFELENEEDFERINESELDEYVNKETSFSSWEEMKGKAGAIYIKKQLGF